jgi:hypothetical protein|tara:strand:+ start:694 stop:963 length:270 start_codon:yes stop_codon:yes gene_type:complete
LKKLDIPDKIMDKIFEIKFESDESIFKFISYFPLSKLECQTISSLLFFPNSCIFHSIFTDPITDDEWDRSKNQIKKRFQNELFDIDSKL